MTEAKFRLPIVRMCYVSRNSSRNVTYRLHTKSNQAEVILKLHNPEQYTHKQTSKLFVF